MKLPVTEARKLIKLLILKGYIKTGQSGSHVQFKNEKGNIITVPVHPGRPVTTGVLRKIIRDMELSREEFIELLDRI